METLSFGQGATAGTYKAVVSVSSHYFKKPVPAAYSDPTRTPLLVEIPEGGADKLKVHLAQDRKVDAAEAKRAAEIARALGIGN